MIAISLCLLCGRGSIFFVQTRIGKDGREFSMYKFRTMVEGADVIKQSWKNEAPELWAEYKNNNFKLKNDSRITKLGKILRKTSLDELPQIINIIKGDMNFIGPRPILPEERGDYGKSIKSYIKIKPGITCLWQVNGRSDTDFQDRVIYDRLYVIKRSFKLDFFILLKTVLVVLTGKGSY